MAMVNFYVLMVQRGLKNREDIPAKYRDEVIAILDAEEE